MYVGTIRYYPFGDEEQKVFLHLSAFYRDTNLWRDGARILLEGLQNHPVYGNGTIAEDVDDTNGDQAGVDFGFQFWRDNLRLEGEFMYMRLARDIDRDPAAVIAARRQDLEVYGISASIAYFFELSEEDMGLEPFFKLSYTSIDDRKKDDNSTGGIGQPLGTVTNIQGQDIWEVVMGLRFHASRHLRFDLNYLLYDLAEGGSGLSNQTTGHDGRVMSSLMFQFVARW
jgi:hypothetical protein